jgi:PhnB protein
MKNINAYINFNGKCREAMTFYKDCIDGELKMMTVEGSPVLPVSLLENLLISI